MSGYVRNLAQAARAAQAAIAAAEASTRRALLEGMAERLLAGQDAILEANAGDLARARQAGAGKATLDRLALDPERVRGMAEALREVAAQADPLGEVTNASSKRGCAENRRISSAPVWPRAPTRPTLIPLMPAPPASPAAGRTAPRSVRCGRSPRRHTSTPSTSPA